MGAIGLSSIDTWRIMMDVSVQNEVGIRPKRQKFRDLAEKRTNRALDAIRRLGNLSNTQIYEWEDPEIRKIIKALKDAISEVENRFEAPRGKSEPGFKL